MVIPDCQKDIMFLIDTSACMEPSFPRINRAQIEIIEKVAEKFGFGSDGTARIGLMHGIKNLTITGYLH